MTSLYMLTTVGGGGGGGGGGWWWWRGGGDKFFVMQEKSFSLVTTWYRPKIDVKSWFSIPVVTVKFSLFARKFEIMPFSIVKSWCWHQIFRDLSFATSAGNYMMINYEIMKSTILGRENLKCTIYYPWWRELIGYPYCSPRRDTSVINH